jgi:hypothetical protein
MARMVKMEPRVILVLKALRVNRVTQVNVVKMVFAVLMANAAQLVLRVQRA